MCRGRSCFPPANRKDGRSGLAGWQWLFIVDFLITIPIAIYGYVVFPDTPSTTTAKYLTAEEKKCAVERMPKMDKQRGEMGWGLLRRVFSTWHVYAFVPLWVFASNTEMFSTNAILNLWLKSLGRYTTEEVDYIPTGVSAVGIVMTLTLGWYSDLTRQRWHVGVILSATALISGAIMLRPPSDGAKFFALFLNGAQYASQTAMFAWANDLLHEDDAKRSFILAAMNTFSVAVFMFWSILFYSTTEGPDWFEGSVAMIAMACAFFFWTVSMHYVEMRDSRKNVLGGVEEAREDGQGEIPVESQKMFS